MCVCVCVCVCVWLCILASSQDTVRKEQKHDPKSQQDTVRPFHLKSQARKRVSWCIGKGRNGSVMRSQAYNVVASEGALHLASHSANRDEGEEHFLEGDGEARRRQRRRKEGDGAQRGRMKTRKTKLASCRDLGIDHPFFHFLFFHAFRLHHHLFRFFEETQKKTRKRTQFICV